MFKINQHDNNYDADDSSQVVTNPSPPTVVPTSGSQDSNKANNKENPVSVETAQMSTTMGSTSDVDDASEGDRNRSNRYVKSDYIKLSEIVDITRYIGN